MNLKSSILGQNYVSGDDLNETTAKRRFDIEIAVDEGFIATVRPGRLQLVVTNHEMEQLIDALVRLSNTAHAA